MKINPALVFEKRMLVNTGWKRENERFHVFVTLRVREARKIAVKRSCASNFDATLRDSND